MLIKTLRYLANHGVKRTAARIFDVLYIKAVFAIKPAHVHSLYGPKFKANFTDATFGFYIRADYGHYLAHFIKGMNRPFGFLDIGANQGLYSVLAARNPNCTRVWAFEPVTKTHDLLRTNVSLNRNAEKITLVDAAISDLEGQKNINANPTHSGGASLNHAIDGAVGEPIRCISFESLQDIVRVQADARLLVKIDTEGHEPVVIAELRKSSFWPNVTFLFFEVDTHWFDGEAVVRSLIDDGFAEVHRTSDTDHYDVMMKRV